MGSMTIRQIDDEMKARLRRRAADTGRSVEGEVRHILRRDLERDEPNGYPVGMALRPGETWVDYLIRITRPGVELELPTRAMDDTLPPDLG